MERLNNRADSAGMFSPHLSPYNFDSLRPTGILAYNMNAYWTFNSRLKGSRSRAEAKLSASEIQRSSGRMQDDKGDLTRSHPDVSGAMLAHLASILALQLPAISLWPGTQMSTNTPMTIKMKNIFKLTTYSVVVLTHSLTH